MGKYIVYLAAFLLMVISAARSEDLSGEKPTVESGSAGAVSENASALADSGFEKERRRLMEEGYLNAEIVEGAVEPGALFKIREMEIVSFQNYTPEELGLAGYLGQNASAATVEEIGNKAGMFFLNAGYLFFSLRFDLEAIHKDGRPVLKGEERSINSVKLKIAIDRAREE